MEHNFDVNKTILRIIRKFQEGVPVEKKIKYLQQLFELPISLTSLKETGIGKVINKLRSSDNDAVITEKAESLVAKWKKLASKEKSQSSPVKHNQMSNNGHQHEPSVSSISLMAPKIIKEEKEGDNSDEEETNKNNKISTGGVGGVSFSDALMMPFIDNGKKKKKKKKKEDDLLKMPLPTNLDVMDESGAFTPELVYKPNFSFPAKFEPKKQNKDVSNRNVDITSKKTRSQMYSGKKTSSNGTVQRLHQLCLKALIDKFDLLYETGGIPYFILEPLLVKCTPDMLQRFEYYNDYILEDTDVLWKKHCCTEFKISNIRKQEGEEWRETFLRLSQEREDRLKRLSSKINAAQAAKQPERSTKLAYVAGALRGGHMRKPKAEGFNLTGEKRKALIDRIDKDQRSTAEVAIPFAKIPRRDRCSRRPPSSLSATNRHNVPSAPNSHKKRHGGGASSDIGTHGGPSSSSSSSHSHSSTIRKPVKQKPTMMAAAMKLLKNQKGRSASQIIRR